MTTLRRSPLWDKVRTAFIKANPVCAACKSITDLEVHHKIPFHINPSLELVESNLVTLCGDKSNNCHNRVGHLGDFQLYNPYLNEDLQFLAKILAEFNSNSPNPSDYLKLKKSFWKFFTRKPKVSSIAFRLARNDADAFIAIFNIMDMNRKESIRETAVKLTSTSFVSLLSPP